MDISALKPSERIVEIKSPADAEENIGIRVTLLSVSDNSLKALKRKFQDKKLKLEQRGKNWTAEQLDENQKELAFAAMTGWEWYGDVDYKGKKPAFDRATVYQLFDELPWFLTQIQAAMSEEQSFFVNSKAS
jgi:hypothetical protein